VGDPKEAPDMTGPEPAAGSRSLVLLFRVALLGLAALAVGTAVFSGRVHDAGSAGSSARYVCPMHPDVTSASPGICPICRMDLERVGTSGDRPSAAAIDSTTYLNYDIMRKRGTGPDTPAPAWVEDDGSISAVVYDDELSGLSGDGVAFFYVPGSSGETAVHPVLTTVQPWDRSTSRVTFRVAADAGAPSAAGPPTPGEVGRVRLATRGSELPLIPYSALLEGAEGPYVLVSSPDGRVLTKRPIVVGKSFGGMVFVLSGLGPRERVLTRSAFFVDAERRLRRETMVEVKR
jgi:hypothetical protein